MSRGYGFAMGAKARQNAARKSGHRAMLDKIAEEQERGCNVAKRRNWSAPPCDCPTVVSFTLKDGTIVRSCGEHTSTLGPLMRGGA